MRDGTIVYVHGAGDRIGPDPRQGVLAHGQLIRERLAELGREFEVVVCTWGDARGSSLDGMPATMPDVDGTRTTDIGWEQLRHDPFVPISRFGAVEGAQGDARSSSSAAATIADGYLLLWIERGLGSAERIDGFEPSQVDAAVSQAAARVRASSEFASARAVVGDFVGLVGSAARTVAALAASILMGDAGEEDAYAQVASRIGAGLGLLELMAFLTILADHFLSEGQIPDAIGVLATDRLRRVRYEFMLTGILGFGDILLYQRNGGAIRGYVGDHLRTARLDEDRRREAGESRGRVVALGNSLGGIILAEVLAGRAARDCDLFVTVGSQPGALRALRALGPAASRRPFRPWVNILDPRDFLGFLAAPVWPGAAGIEDVEIDLHRGFPHTHGRSYFEVGSPAVREIIARLDRLTVD
jgi:hypothetical protein